MKLRSFYIKTLVIAFAAALLCTSAAFATENGTSSYPNGSEDFLAHFNDHGWNIVDYLSYRHNTNLMDNDGNKLKVPFDSKATVNTFRLIYNTNISLFGGKLGFHTLIPVVDLDLKTPAGKDSASGVADVVVGFNDAFHGKNRHIIVGADATLPTGAYDKNDIANLGSNHYTFEPFVITQYITDTGFEIGGKFMYDYNTENNDTNYKNGQEVHVDYVIGQHFGPYNVGLGGYIYQQITDDKENGATVDDSKGKASGIGPVFKYDYKNAAFTLKYVKDYDVANRSEGDQWWFKVNYAF